MTRRHPHPYSHAEVTDVRPIPPHGVVSPDGRRAWPEPSLTAKIVVIGGAAVMATAATAGAVMASRKLAGMIGRDEDDHRPRQTRRYADLNAGEAARESAPPRHLYGNDGVRGGDDRPSADRPSADRPFASRPAAPRQNLADGLADQAGRLAANLNSVVAAINGAVLAFRGVAGQAGTIVHEFGSAADKIRTFLDDRGGRARWADAERRDAAAGTYRPGDAAERRQHRL